MADAKVRVTVRSACHAGERRSASAQVDPDPANSADVDDIPGSRFQRLPSALDPFDL